MGVALKQQRFVASSFPHHLAKLAAWGPCDVLATRHLAEALECDPFALSQARYRRVGPRALPEGAFRAHVVAYLIADVREWLGADLAMAQIAGAIGVDTQWPGFAEVAAAVVIGMPPRGAIWKTGSRSLLESYFTQSLKSGNLISV